MWWHWEHNLSWANIGEIVFSTVPFKSLIVWYFLCMICDTLKVWYVTYSKYKMWHTHNVWHTQCMICNTLNVWYVTQFVYDMWYYVWQMFKSMYDMWHNQCMIGDTLMHNLWRTQCMICVPLKVWCHIGCNLIYGTYMWQNQCMICEILNVWYVIYSICDMRYTQSMILISNI